MKLVLLDTTQLQDKIDKEKIRRKTGKELSEIRQKYVYAYEDSVATS